MCQVPFKLTVDRPGMLPINVVCAAEYRQPAKRTVKAAIKTRIRAGIIEAVVAGRQPWRDFSRIALSRRPTKVASADQMNMEVKHALPSTRPDVKHGSVTILNAVLVRQFRRNDVAVTD